MDRYAYYISDRYFYCLSLLSDCNYSGLCQWRRSTGIYITFILVGWIVYARVIKGLSASFRKQEWVASAQTLGIPGVKIILRHLLPNVLPQAVVVLMTDMVGLLVAIVTLGYLGIGIAPPTPDWGTMISDGQSFITTAWWLSAVPGLAVVYTGIALSLVGDGLADLWRRK